MPDAEQPIAEEKVDDHLFHHDTPHYFIKESVIAEIQLIHYPHYLSARQQTTNEKVDLV